MGQGKVLVVDDELSFLEMMGERLTSWGYASVTASNGRQAMEVLASQKPDVVILDYVMPDMDGIQLFAKIRAVDKKIPVIMFTAKPEPEVIEKSRQLDVLAFVPKESSCIETQGSLQVALAMAFKKI